MSVEQEIKEMLSEKTGMDVDEIHREAKLIDDLGIDSLKIIEIATFIEKTYKVKVKESQMTKIKTVEDVINIIKESKQAPGTLQDSLL